MPDISVRGSGDSRQPRLRAAVRRGEEGDGMPIQLLVGSCVSAVNIMIHALVTVLAIRAARAAGLRSTRHQWLRLVGIMIATTLVLMVAHTLEVFVWSFAYAIVNAV